MIIYLGADHRGYALKEKLKEDLVGGGHTVHDLTPDFTPGDDYPKVAYTVVKKLHSAPEARGMLFCGSSAGVVIAANRFPGMRATLALNVAAIIAARHDDNINILAFAADFTIHEEAAALADAFLSTPYEPDERYERRIKELDNPPSL